MMLRPMPRPGSLENIRSGGVLVASLWRVAIRTCVQDEDWFGADEDGADAALMRIVAQCGCACVLRGWFVCVCGAWLLAWLCCGVQDPTAGDRPFVGGNRTVETPDPRHRVCLQFVVLTGLPCLIRTHGSRRSRGRP